MKEDIINNLNNPAQLEKLYRSGKNRFRQDFIAVYPKISENATAQVWFERLNFGSENIFRGSARELVIILVASFAAGVIAKLPDFTGWDADMFYLRNIGFVLFPLLTFYFAWRQNLPLKIIGIALVAMIISLVYINLLPGKTDSHTMILACLHLPLFLWAVTGFAFLGKDMNNPGKRLEYLRFTADLLIMGTLLGIAGVIFSGITIALFSLLDIPAEDYYFSYIGIWGLAAIPFIATYLVMTGPHLVSRISPIIAKIFTPLVLVTLLVYLGMMIYTGKDPYNDREFLLMFNLLLLGVMALILFALTGIPRDTAGKPGLIILLILSALTVLVNGVALSAIIFRISEWGITPNRLAVLGSNILMLANLLIVTFRLFKTLKNHHPVEMAENAIARFLPVYIIWIMLVVFVFPVIFAFR
jgi:hypothetical protein